MSKKMLVVAFALCSIALFGCAVATEEEQLRSYDTDALAKCLTEKGIREYGSMTCSACAATKKMFGESMQFIDYVECHPNGPNTQVDLCLKRDIHKTPTWILEREGEEVSRIEGFKIFEELSEFSGCPLVQ